MKYNMRKITALLLAFSLIFAFSTHALAAQELVVDQEFHLTDEEITELINQAETIGNSYNVDIAVLFASLGEGESTADYVENYYKQNFLKDGIILAINAEAKEWAIYTSGRLNELVTDDEKESIWNALTQADTTYKGIQAYYSAVASVLLNASGREIPDERQLPLLVDDAELLSEQQAADLSQKLEEISKEYLCDVAIVTNSSIGSYSAQAYADDFYDYNGYGYGENNDGILLLVSMEDRDYAISTCGYGIEAFTDAGLDYIEEKFLSYISDGDYAKGFDEFANQTAIFLNQARNEGEPFDQGNLPRGSVVMYIGASLIIGLAGAFIVVMIMKGAHKSVIAQNYASSYVTNSEITDGSDIYLYRNVVRTKRESSSSGGGGGSSTHISSSGTSHGGSSGKF